MSNQLKHGLWIVDYLQDESIIAKNYLKWICELIFGTETAYDVCVDSFL